MRRLVGFIRKRGVATTSSTLLALASLALSESGLWDNPYISGAHHAFAVVCAVGALICWAAIPPDGSAGIKVKNSPRAVVERNVSSQYDTGIEIEGSPDARVIQNVTDEASDAEEGADSQPSGT
jgi:hypothetical protein